MKTQSILVPTNFSRMSDSVLSVAEELAHKENSGFCMLHAYDADNAGLVPGYRDIAVKRMKHLVQAHHMEEWPHRCFLRQGSMARSIKKLTREQPISLVVLDKGWAEPEVISRSASPVLVVPYGTLDHEISSIVYATENAYKERDLIMQAMHFASLFDAEFTLLHVNVQGKQAEKWDATSMPSLVDYNRIKNEYIRVPDLVEGLQKYLSNKKADIAAVAGVSGGWLVNHKSKHYIKKLLAYPDLPLLFINSYSKN